jgi:acyl carrier protein
MEQTRDFISNVPASARRYAPIAAAPDTVPPASEPVPVSPAMAPEQFQTKTQPTPALEQTDPAPHTASVAATSDTPVQPDPASHKKSTSTPGQKDISPSSASLPAPSLPVQQILYEIVARLTGFPVEMLEPDMDIESDLGIDSIKRVEIISELESQIPQGEGLSTDHMGSIKTLADICRAISSEIPPPAADIPAHSAASFDSADTPNLPDSPDFDLDNSGKIFAVLVSAISELTGFPVEMLEPEMNLESDLGIDSIKRVEILSKLEQELDDINAISSDDMAGLKNIQDIVQFLTPDIPTGVTIGEQANNNKKKNFSPCQ